MRAALIRLEDVGPGGRYETGEDQFKLRIVADYLFAERVPFHVAVISRFMDPARGIDRTIERPFDPATSRFVRILHGWSARGASLGMHGYTHQYGASVSGEGYEFAYPGCREHCPPDDVPASLNDIDSWQRSYAYGRFRAAFHAFLSSGLRPDWFETPHYAASDTQRRILEACSCILYEDNPAAPGSRRVTERVSKSWVGKTYYIPTPLGYVGGAAVEQDVGRIIREAERYGDADLASFFFHPFLEFPYIQTRQDGTSSYDDDSPLHRLVRAMKEMGRRFVTIPSWLNGSGSFQYPRLPQQ
ncbi:DUF2334 domain-containing protein [Cohnella sp. CFH 77786]|uniref:DUF2334 domain-containing protein n=1 Tax=Cohnella sp. CFH 77786 TaxID=2662265 RepID=UPI001C60D74F|nr:DUF2334 domain-containing protein [Cohnella sp. CFH 77786]